MTSGTIISKVNNTTVIHTNTATISVGNEIVGRIRTLSATLEGSADDFWELGTPYVAQIEIINKKVSGTIERGLVNAVLLQMATGAYEKDGSLLTGSDVNFVGHRNAELTVSASNSPLIESIEFDIIIDVSLVQADGVVVNRSIVYKDCKLSGGSIGVNNNDYIIGNYDFHGKRVYLNGFSTPVTL